MRMFLALMCVNLCVNPPPPSGTLHVERTKELYRDLLSVFDKLILPTHASCHVQYTLFYLCSFRLVSRSHTAHDFRPEGSKR